MVTIAQVDFREGLQGAWEDIATFVPQFAGFLVIAIIGYFVARIIARIIDRVLERAGFDRLVERGGIKKALERSEYDASTIVSKVVFYTLFLFTLQIAFGVFGSNPVSDVLDSVVAFLPKLFVALVIVVIAAAIGQAVRGLVASSLGGLSYGITLARVAGAAILAIGVFAALNQVEVAPEIVNGLFYAILAVIAGSAIVAIGGGGIVPMQRKWQSALRKMEDEQPKIRQEMAKHREITLDEPIEARGEGPGG